MREISMKGRQVIGALECSERTELFKKQHYAANSHIHPRRGHGKEYSNHEFFSGRDLGWGEFTKWMSEGKLKTLLPRPSLWREFP